MKRTPLYDAHVAAGAKLVDFAGWEMPIQYEGISQEHLAVRKRAGLFDVSHMGEVRVTGGGATEFLRYATLNDVAKLKPGRGQYSMLPNDYGGLVDDLYIYCEDENDFLMVANAANKDEVLEHLRYVAEEFAGDFNLALDDESEAWALLALQGPEAVTMLGSKVEELATLKKNRLIETSIDKAKVKLARTGYTGEDGFEIFCQPDDAVTIWDMLLAAGAAPCGLGARDTLRLEAGFPLYGHEFTGDTNPLCSDYAWVVKDKDFFGREEMWNPKCERRLVGLELSGRGIPRQGYCLYVGDENVGEVTSGTVSPLTKRAIAMAWVDSAVSEIDQNLMIEIRGQRIPATVSKPPFYP